MSQVNGTDVAGSVRPAEWTAEDEARNQAKINLENWLPVATTQFFCLLNQVAASINRYDQVSEAAWDLLLAVQDRHDVEIWPELAAEGIGPSHPMFSECVGLASERRIPPRGNCNGIHMVTESEPCTLAFQNMLDLIHSGKHPHFPGPELAQAIADATYSDPADSPDTWSTCPPYRGPCGGT